MSHFRKRDIMDITYYFHVHNIMDVYPVKIIDLGSHLDLIINDKQPTSLNSYTCLHDSPGRSVQAIKDLLLRDALPSTRVHINKAIAY